MSGKQDKKIKQQYRRDMRAGVREIVDEFKKDVIGNPPINQKPKYWPRFVWTWVVTKVVNQSFFDKWYGQI